jgi:hypothetical protein
VISVVDEFVSLVLIPNCVIEIGTCYDHRVITHMKESDVVEPGSHENKNCNVIHVVLKKDHDIVVKKNMNDDVHHNVHKNKD